MSKHNLGGLSMDNKEKHKRWKSEKLNAYDCLPENHNITLRPVLIPASHIYEDYLKFKTAHEKIKISSKKEVRQKPEVIIKNKIKQKSSKSIIEIPNTIISRRIRKNTASLSKSLAQVFDNKEIKTEKSIENRKRLRYPQVSSHNFTRSQKLNRSIQALCTNRYPEGEESPAWHKEPIRKWTVRPSIIFSKKPKFKWSHKGKRIEFLLKTQIENAKNDILGIFNNCQEEISSRLNESSKFH